MGGNRNPNEGQSATGAGASGAHVQRYWLDVRRRGLGYEYVVGATVAPERSGWRLTKRWAKGAGKRCIRKLGGGS